MTKEKELEIVISETASLLVSWKNRGVAPSHAIVGSLGLILRQSVAQSSGDNTRRVVEELIQSAEEYMKGEAE